MSNEQKEQAIISGGPGQGDDAPPPAAGTITEVTQGDAEKKPLFNGIGRTIDTQEDLVNYATHLERQNVEMRMKIEKTPEAQAGTSFQNNNQPPPAPAAAQSTTSAADLLFSDPDQALKLVKEEAKREIRAETMAKEEEQKFWSDLYREAPDLQNADIVVKSVLNENWAEISKAPISQARKILAEKSRMIVKGIRGESGTVTEVPNTPQATFGTSNGSTPSKAAPPKSVSFMDQVKKFQRKG